MAGNQKLTFNIRETAEILVPDQLGRVSYGISLLLVGSMAGLITATLSKLPVVVPLYFTLPWGEARLASRTMLYLLPGLGLVIMGVNLSLGKVTARLSPLLPKTLSVGTLVITLMLLLSTLGIWQSLVVL